MSRKSAGRSGGARSARQIGASEAAKPIGAEQGWRVDASLPVATFMRKDVAYLRENMWVDAAVELPVRARAARRPGPGREGRPVGVLYVDDVETEDSLQGATLRSGAGPRGRRSEETMAGRAEARLRPGPRLSPGRPPAAARARGDGPLRARDLGRGLHRQRRARHARQPARPRHGGGGRRAGGRAPSLARSWSTGWSSRPAASGRASWAGAAACATSCAR